MEVMLDALMQRGIGKPDDKPKEEPPPALPTRPTVRGRPPSLNRPGAGPAPWMSSHRPPLAPIPLPPQEEEEKGKSSVHLELEICERKNLELETRALNAEEEVKQRDDDVRQKEEEIAALRQQVEHYESRVSEYELKLKSVEEELQKQTIALQVAQSAGITHRRQLSNSAIRAKTQALATRAEDASTSASVSMKRQPRGGGDPGLVDDKKQSNHADDNLANEFTRESQKFDHAAKAVAEAPPSVMSVDELKVLKRQFGAWRKEYEARLRKTKGELKKRVVHSEKSHDQGGGGGGHGSSSSSSSRLRGCSCSCWSRIKAPKFKQPKCCTCNMKLPSPPSCSFCCWFRRRR
ncbi:hypothetical protein BRADI_4g19610v3 [Brachypodium distachyon]|uniref:Uncharacterized protein n=2 Tax=Brachypodium distachyon TaxID=15368 RepID=A0A0Q3ELZ9_BRADI|nr:hypothetical protein BRADI_4g19610v3 [Brachypodium distachyon]